MGNGKENTERAERMKAAARTVRALSMDMVEAAQSGHPGMPLGAAELGAVLFGEVMNLSPEEPDWINRDRLVLSAGHGSAWLYSLLYLAGYGLTREDLKQFRQAGSRTPGHPEYGVTPGVETTTGPLGAGFSNAVGMAAAESHLAARFNREGFPLIDHYTYTVAGDGCMMEGVSSEAASLAGHWGLGKLIAFYDSNGISIEGSTDLAFTEDTAGRFRAYGWQVLEGDGRRTEEIRSLVEQAQGEENRPSLIILRTTIGFGAPQGAGTAGVHGSPLGKEEIQEARRTLGIPEGHAFYTDPQAEELFARRRREWKARREAWEAMFRSWAETYPAERAEWDRMMAGEGLSIEWPEDPVPGEAAEATRKASGRMMQAIAASWPGFAGGSADLAPSNKSELKGLGDYSRENRKGRNFHFGVREHAMGGIVNGMTLHGGLQPFGATFLVFSDYMRPALRLAALMGLPAVFVFTHDSLWVGEDGPTHQPVEQLAALRSIPGLTVLRPADAAETRAAWAEAVENREGPTALVLSRQELPALERPAGWEAWLRRGAAAVWEPPGGGDKIDAVVAASGSETAAGVEAARWMMEDGGTGGGRVRVVSVLDREGLFRMPAEDFRKLFPEGVPVLVFEAGISQGWEALPGYAGGLFASGYGLSGPGEEVIRRKGLTPEALLERLKELLRV